MQRTLSIILLPLTVWLSAGIINAASANECPLFQYPEKLNQQDIIGNINLSCMDQLNPVDYAKLVSMIISERNSKSIIHAASTNQAEVYNQLVEKTLSKYIQNQNANYGNALLDLLDAQKLAKLQDYFSDDCTPLSKNKINPKNQEAILYMHSLPGNRFLSLLLTKNNISIAKITETNTVLSKANDLKSTIESLQGITEDKNNPGYQKLRETAKYLYNTILRPFETSLDNNITHLVIIPDALTGIMPMEALWDEMKNEYVLNKGYSISYAPNLSQISNKTYKGNEVLFVSSEAPTNNETDLTNTASLDSTIDSGFNQDLTLLEKNYSSIIKLQGNKATKAGLFNTLNNQSMSILHIATHAKFSQDFRKSYIQLYDDRKDANEGKLLVQDFERMMVSSSARKQPPDLIVLSACESAQGGNGMPDASLGLAGVAARSGVNSVIAGLWVLNIPEVLVGPKGGTEDVSLGDDYSEYFYHIIAREPAITKAKALQRSKQGIQKNRSIFDWAALVLIGDWGPM